MIYMFLSYRELQMEAKCRSIPANLSRDDLIKQIHKKPKYSSGFLTKRDNYGKVFNLQNATFCNETTKNRLARDVFIYTFDKKGELKFLLKKWKDPNHRATVNFGNSFGTFIYRPPKNLEDARRSLEYATPLWAKSQNGWLLTFPVNGLGPKNELLANLLNLSITKMIKMINNLQVYGIIIPSSFQDSKSSIHAPMISLASFIEVQENIVIPQDMKWVSAIDACNPKKNVHAGISTFWCEHENIKLLKNKSFKLTEIQIHRPLQNFLNWGQNLDQIYGLIQVLLPITK